MASQNQLGTYWILFCPLIANLSMLLLLTLLATVNRIALLRLSMVGSWARTKEGSGRAEFAMPYYKTWTRFLTSFVLMKRGVDLLQGWVTMITTEPT